MRLVEDDRVLGLMRSITFVVRIRLRYEHPGRELVVARMQDP
jgi:hypothetical protein